IITFQVFCCTTIRRAFVVHQVNHDARDVRRRTGGCRQREDRWMINTQSLAVSIAEAVRLTGIGRSSLYEAIRRGDLPIRKSGRRTVLLMEDLRRWLAGLPTPHGSEVRRGR